MKQDLYLVTVKAWLNKLYNGFTKLFDVPKPSFEQIGEMEQYTDAVTKVLQQYKDDVPIYNKCYADVAREIVKAMYDITNKAK